MSEKFSQFFKGKMSKSVYISAVSAVICGAVVITSTVVVHEKNKKIDSILKSTVSSSCTTESVTENALSTENTTFQNTSSATSAVFSSSTTEPDTESALSTENNTLQNTSSATNNVPSEDKAMQYLKEYEKITADYEKQRETLIEQIKPILITREEKFPNKPQLPKRAQGGAGNYVETEEEYASRVAHYELDLKEWEKESIAHSIAVSETNEQIKRDKAEQEKIQNQIEQLDEKYKQDVEKLKKQYGVK